MTRAIKGLVGLILLAAVVFGSIEVLRHHESDGRSPYEKLEDDLEAERAAGKDTFPLATPA